MKQIVELTENSLTEKQEAFARYFVECRNASTAYRMAYNVGHDTLPATVWSEASRIANLSHVAARVQLLREAAEAHTIVKVREIVQDLVDQSTTDANELVQLRTRCCRHCHGFEGRYQWMDENEFRRATEKTQEDIDAGVKRVRFPDPLGGFDFNPDAAPNPRCASCEGAGRVLVTFTDTDKLSTKARKLYKGAKVTSQGTELLMHDAQASRIELLKVLGAYGKDVTLNPAAAAQPIQGDVSEHDAATAYLEMVN
jgi:phage terminase small subunit